MILTHPDIQDPSKSTPNAGPATKSPAYLRMAEDWPLIDALWETTKGCRAAGKAMLPQWAKESDENYQRRLARATCMGFFRDSIEGLASRPFEKPMTFAGAEPSVLAEIRENADGEGSSLDALGKRMLEMAIRYGVAHAYVDTTAKAPTLTRADDRRARPMVKLLSPKQVFAAETDDAGTVTLLRIAEIREEKAIDNWGTKEVQHVLEFIREGQGYTLNVYRLDIAGGKWDPTETSIIRGDLPFATLNLSGVSRFEAEPPLLRLAEVEREHYQHVSDHSNNLGSSVGAVWVSGASSEELEKGFYMGPNALNGSTNPAARAEYLEPGGNALAARLAYIDRLESKMRELGARPAVQAATARTATEVAVADGRASSVLHEWVSRTETALRQVIVHAAAYRGETVADDFEVTLFTDWKPASQNQAELDILDRGRARKDIDRETYLSELQRRGVLDESIEIADVLAAVTEEGDAALANLPDFSAQRQPGQQPAQGTPPGSAA